MINDEKSHYSALPIESGHKGNPEAEEFSPMRFEDLVQYSPFGLSIMRPDQTYEFLNDKFTDIFGYSLEDIPDKQTWFKKAYPDPTYRAMIKQAWLNDAIKVKPGISRDRTFRVRCKDGKDKIIKFSNTKLADGKHYMSYEDVTENYELSQQLKQAQKMEAVGTLAGGIAHDFNNILGAILGMAEASLLKGNDPASLNDNLGNIRDMAIRGRDLVRRLLSFCRQDDQLMRSLDMAEVAEETVEFIKATIPSNISIQKVLTFGAMVMADPIQMQQVLLNLCTNAAQAMEPDGGEMTISLVRTDAYPKERRIMPELEDGPYVLIQVRDTGCGMAPDVLERMFDPFFTTKPQGQGTGLGLSVAHGIVSSHGGVVQAFSQEGQGTTVNVILPQATMAVVQKAENEAQEPSRGSGEHILVIDDEEIIARATAQTLEAFGYRVTAFSSSLEALQALRDNPTGFDAILTDHIMPGMTGLQFAEKAKEISKHTPVVMVTGMPSGVDEKDHDSIAKLLTKPVTAMEIGQSIQAALLRSG
jgi:two-component system cell cycle sensor histidine kinase/response regulator CckA